MSESCIGRREFMGAAAGAALALALFPAEALAGGPPSLPVIMARIANLVQTPGSTLADFQATYLNLQSRLNIMFPDP